jgi:D-cysteine desulfhydrase
MLRRRPVVVALVFSSFSGCAHSAAYSPVAHEYDPPTWTKGHLTESPRHGRLRLAHLPTPLYRIDTNTRAATWNGSSRPTKDLFATLSSIGASLHVKRDDSTGGVEVGGNKIRKLEFLLAHAIATGCTAVVTIGGVQSNHCRATAAAARMTGLEPHLILRCAATAPTTMDGAEEMIGNLLIDRVMASRIYTCTPGEYGRLGSQALVMRLCAYLNKQNGGGTTKAYPIPVGGSNGLGSWGYIEGVNELLQQWKEQQEHGVLDHVVFACGSGGTAAGIVLGMALAHGALKHATGSPSKKMPVLHAIAVCDDPDYFYQTISVISDQMGLALSDTNYSSTEDFMRAHLTIHQGKGRGYAQSTEGELEFVASFARATGIVLDPVYTGKALYHFIHNVVEPNPESFRNQNILFWHTGGALGLYDKCQDLVSKTSLLESSPCQQLDIYGNGVGIDVSI